MVEQKFLLKTPIFYFLGMVFFLSCQKESFVNSGQIVLGFSTDTLRFDTVFTEVGSITRSFKVYNHGDEHISIDRVAIRDGSKSFFRINADGIAAPVIEDLKILAGDSIYVFVEVTIDPDMPLSVSPFIIEDAIRIRAGDSEYSVILEAWGQNAHYIPDRYSNSRLTYYSCAMGQWEWNDEKPYVIYGSLVIDSCHLIMPPGTRIYVHGGIAINELGVYNDGLLILLENATLTTNGTPEAPVTFLSDRLEEAFEDVSGQWSGIILGKNSKDNELNHTVIRHSRVGISVDSAASVFMKACELGYIAGHGISARHANIYAENTLIYQTGLNGIQLGYGGNYNFNYCTVANYDNQETALFASNFTCSDPLCLDQVYLNTLNAHFTNCIFVGNSQDELTLVDATEGADPGTFNYHFRNCIVEVDDLLAPDRFPNFFDNCIDCINTQFGDTLFIDQDTYDFHLDTMSIAIDKAVPLLLPVSDKDGLPRETDFPDIGCYEFQK